MLRLFRRPRNALIVAGTAGLGTYYALASSSSVHELRDESKRYSPPPHWSPPSRREAIERLKASSKNQNDVFDLLVIGGGATGAGVALDAASRGLKVALIEKNDFSSGTSLNEQVQDREIDGFRRNFVKIDKARPWRC